MRATRHAATRIVTVVVMAVASAGAAIARGAAAAPAAAPTSGPFPSWTVTTVATGFPYPVAVTTSGTDVFVADARTATVFHVAPNAPAVRVAGTGTAGYNGDGGPANVAQLNDPRGLAFDGAGSLYVADTGNDRVRRIAPDGTITTLAGSGRWGVTADGSRASDAALEGVGGVAVDASGAVYFSETAANRVRRVDPTTGALATVTGNGLYGYGGDGGPASAAQLAGPVALAFDGSSALLIVDAGNERIRKVSTTGTITTVAGNGQTAEAGDGGLGPAAALDIPTGVAADRSGDAFITEAAGQRVREVAASTGVIYTVAGTGSPGGGDGGVGPAVGLDDPEGVAVDAAGNVLVADAGNHGVRSFMPPAPLGCAARLPSRWVVGLARGTSGYVLAAADGAAAAFGGAACAGSQFGAALASPIVAVVPTPDGAGYWMAAADGGVFTFGDAHYFGSAGSVNLAAPIVGMTSTPDGNGYWLVAADGGIFTFGDAGFFGSAGDVRLQRPIVGMASTADGGGYWLVAADGGIFTYGNAPFLGSAVTVQPPLQRPIVGMASTADGGGYWLVAADGGIFTYGTAPFLGSAVGAARTPVTGMEATADRAGYWMVGSDGGVFTFGDAQFAGSAS